MTIEQPTENKLSKNTIEQKNQKQMSCKMNIKHLSLLFLCSFMLLLSAQAQVTLSLDSCRTKALEHNTTLKINQAKRDAAHAEMKSARGNYLPQLTLNAGYLHSEKEMSLLSDDQKTTLNGLGTSLETTLNGLASTVSAIDPTAGALISGMSSGVGVQGNALGQQLVSDLRTDTREMYGGIATLTQPLYMGGKIVAYNNITHFAEKIAEYQQTQGVQELILNTDKLYWQVISLKNKERMLESYITLLNKINHNIELSIKEGISTKADQLTVKVKQNEAEMNLTKVKNGLKLVKMALCQNCGLPLDTDLQLADENIETLDVHTELLSFNMVDVYANRPEILSLKMADKIYEAKKNIIRSEYLPHFVAMGSYVVTNPSVYNGFQNEVDGMWNVGVVMTWNVFHWGEGYYKIKKAQTERTISQLELTDAKEKIELQVNQAKYQREEAETNYTKTKSNLEKANENLRLANLGFQEGVIPTSDVLAAHTAWLQAKSALIDAQIDIKMSDIYFKKTLGTL